RIRWNAKAVLHDRAFTGVVSGDRELEIVSEHLEQIAQIGRAAFDVLLGIPGVLNAIALRGRWHELHQTRRSLGRAGKRVIAGFGRDYRVDQRRLERIRLRSRDDIEVIFLAVRFWQGIAAFTE